MAFTRLPDFLKKYSWPGTIGAELAGGLLLRLTAESCISVRISSYFIKVYQRRRNSPGGLIKSILH